MTLAPHASLAPKGRAHRPSRRRLLWALVLVLPGAAQAASLIPDESYCEFGCDIPDVMELSPEDDIPLPEIENPLRLISPFQDYIQDIETLETNSDSEWRAPDEDGAR